MKLNVFNRKKTALDNEFVLERTPNGIITRFTEENKPTTDESGTSITIKLGETAKNLS